jgi:hypothetical protein
MTLNIVNPFKSQTTKTFDKSKISRDVRAGECFASADVNLYPGKRLFKFGTTTTVVDDNLSKPMSLERMVSRTIPANYQHLTLVLQKAVQSSSLFNVRADIHVEKQKKIFSKVKSAKDSISKLFKPTGRISEALPCIDSFSIPSVEHNTVNDHSSSLTPPFVVQHAEPKALVVTPYESIPPRHSSLEVIASPVAYGENVVDEHIEDPAPTFCSPVETSSLPPTAQLFTTLVSQLDRSPSTFLLGGLHTIGEEHGNTEVVVGVMNTEQKELATYGSYTSQSSSDSVVTVYFSSDTLSDQSTPHGVGLVGSETNTSPVDTSFATSVDAEDSRQLSPGALRGLRRVPNYEDLRVGYFKSHSSYVP